jgi:hypothetical protein
MGFVTYCVGMPPYIEVLFPQVKVTGQLNFSSDVPNFWPVKLFSLKQSLVKYTSV